MVAKKRKKQKSELGLGLDDLLNKIPYKLPKNPPIGYEENYKSFFNSLLESFKELDKQLNNNANMSEVTDVVNSIGQSTGLLNSETNPINNTIKDHIIKKLEPYLYNKTLESITALDQMGYKLNKQVVQIAYFHENKIMYKEVEIKTENSYDKVLFYSILSLKEGEPNHDLLKNALEKEGIPLNEITSISNKYYFSKGKKGTEIVTLESNVKNPSKMFFKIAGLITGLYPKEIIKDAIRMRVIYKLESSKNKEKKLRTFGVEFRKRTRLGAKQLEILTDDKIYGNLYWYDSANKIALEMQLLTDDQFQEQEKGHTLEDLKGPNYNLKKKMISDHMHYDVKKILSMYAKPLLTGKSNRKGTVKIDKGLKSELIRSYARLELLDRVIDEGYFFLGIAEGIKPYIKKILGAAKETVLETINKKSYAPKAIYNTIEEKLKKN